MKKFIIVLMVVAAASFLLVGCLPGTTTPVTPVEPVEPVEPVVVTTVAPIITLITDNAAVPAAVISLTSAATQYMSKTEVALGIIVNGTAPTYSEVKVYIDDICAGTADVGVTGTFAVVIAKADLGADAADKAIYATAKEAAIAVSAKSVEYAFVLDTDLPGIKEVKATATQAAVAGGTADTDVVGSAGDSAVVTLADVEDGTWYIEVTAVAGTLENVSIEDPDGEITDYTMLDGGVFAAGSPIPGVSFTLDTPITSPAMIEVECTADVPLIGARATLKFDEDVTYAAAIAGTYTATGTITIPAVLTALVVPTNYSETLDTYYWTVGTLVKNETLVFTVSGVKDLAGNTITASSTASCKVAAASLTALLP